MVGGGLAGCLIASQLAHENLTTVLLEEGANMSEKPKWERQLGCALYAHRLLGKGYERHYTTAPQKPLWEGGDDVVASIPMPKLLGGSGVMGSKSWFFGDAADWDGTPWNFRDDILSRLQRLESVAVTEPHRGKYGKFPVTRATALSPSYRAFSAAMHTHVPLVSVFNRRDSRVLPGCGRPEVFVDPASRMAHQTLDGYLMQTVKLQRPVQLRTQARVTHIAGNGKGKATHVTYVDKEGALQSVDASTVILAAGAIGSAKVACASVEHLFPSPTVNPFIGKGFWDCPSVVLQFQAKDTMQSHNCLTNQCVQLVAYLQTLIGFSPPALSSSYDDLIALWSSTDSPSAPPDIKIIMQPFTINGAGATPADVPNGFQIVVQLARPKSVGEVTSSAVHPNYFADESDRLALQKGVEMVRALVQSQPFLQVVARNGVPVAELFESRGVCGGGLCAGSAVEASNFLLNGTENVYVCDGSLLPKPLIGDRAPALIALADKFVDRYMNKIDVTAKIDPLGRPLESNEVKIIY